MPSPERAPPPERHRVEEAQRRDRAVDRAGVGAALVLMDIEGTQVLGRGGVRRTFKEGGKALDVANVLMLGSRRQTAHHHVVEHPLA